MDRPGGGRTEGRNRREPETSRTLPGAVGSVKRNCARLRAIWGCPGAGRARAVPAPSGHANTESATGRSSKKSRGAMDTSYTFLLPSHAAGMTHPSRRPRPPTFASPRSSKRHSPTSASDQSRCTAHRRLLSLRSRDRLHCLLGRPLHPLGAPLRGFRWCLRTIRRSLL